MKESEIEKKVCTHAKMLGFLTYKFVSPNNRGVPDRIFLKNSKCIFIEFKTSGGKTTELQKYVHQQFKENGFNVYVVDNVEDGIKILKKI